jgi:arginase
MSNRRVAAVVTRVIGEGRLPLVLAGSCNAALGVVAALDAARCGAVWIDAHADFNTPETTVSGYFPGMSAAVVTGACFRDYWAATPLAEDRLVLLGVRDVSPDAERERLGRSAVRVVEWRDGKPRGDPLALLDALAEDTNEVYLHIDFDAFAPDVAPGIVDEPVPGGLSLADAESIVSATTERFRIRAATLATYTPERDEDDRTLRVGVRLIELIAGAT